MAATEIIHFWFEDIEPKQRFIKNFEFDELLRVKFGDVHRLASQGLLYAWREHPLDALAEIIVLDQFPRNMFRDTKQAFATDILALVLAQEAIRKKFDKELDNIKSLISPLMPSYWISMLGTGRIGKGMVKEH